MFLDLKLHDIGNTVQKGVESVAKLGATFLTVHAYPQTMKAAVEGKTGSKLRILAVTVLTSYDDADLAAAGYDFTVGELVAERAAQARDIGVDGLVCSAEEAANLRGIAGPGMVLVTPGIRPAGSATGDQKRIMTPGARDRRRRRLSGGRPADRGGARSEGGGRGDRRGNRTSDGEVRERRDGEGLLDRARRGERRGGLQALRRGESGDLQEIRRAGSSCAAASIECVEGQSRSRNVVIEFPDYATALACYARRNTRPTRPRSGRPTPITDLDHRRGLRRPAAVAGR